MATVSLIGRLDICSSVSHGHNDEEAGIHVTGGIHLQFAEEDMEAHQNWPVVATR